MNIMRSMLLFFSVAWVLDTSCAGESLFRLYGIVSPSIVVGDSEIKNIINYLNGLAKPEDYTLLGVMSTKTLKGILRDIVKVRLKLHTLSTLHVLPYWMNPFNAYFAIEAYLKITIANQESEKSVQELQSAKYNLDSLLSYFNEKIRFGYYEYVQLALSYMQTREIIELFQAIIKQRSKSDVLMQEKNSADAKEAAPIYVEIEHFIVDEINKRLENIRQH